MVSSIPVFKKIRHIHFVGIGGAGMSGIAEVLLKLGYRVTGSDLVKSGVAARLEELGAAVFEGHQGKNIAGADVIVISTAVSKSNPEVKAAQKQGIPVIPRIEMLAEIARLKYTIAISGTHGKTTTTSLVAQILKACDLDPTVVVGGRLKAVGTGGILGRGDYLVAEADESDGSFLKLSPAITVVTNIDNDHLDYYKTEARLREAFIEFANRIPFYGISFLCAEDVGVKRILPFLTRRHATYGFKSSHDFQATDLVLSEFGSKFDVVSKGQRLGAVRLPLAGEHNVLNALSAVAIGLHLGLSFDKISAALSKFEGVGRRIEYKGAPNNVVVVDDYGHHPTEIKATLSAIRNKWKGKRLVVLFQPHRFSRTQLLYKDFGQVLSAADTLYLMPVYPAGEKPIRGDTSKLIAQAVKKKDVALWDGEASFKKLQNDLKPGDVFLTLGAGDVWKIGERLIKLSTSLAPKLAHAFPSLSSRIKAEEPLSRHCTWGIGGPAEVYVEVLSLEEFRQIQKFCREGETPIFILGWGSNVLLPDEGLRGVVVRLRGEFESIQFHNGRVRVGAGVHLPRLAKMCAEKGWAGTEGLAGVPGTVGGALMTNAGTPRGVIGDVVASVDILNSDGSVATLAKEQIALGYRSSNLVGRWIVSAELELKSSSNGDVMKRLKEELEMRERTQPLGTKNVGSVFRTPPHDFAARLIEAAGLKGKQVGRIRFSPKHANFMENVGGATAREALNLIRLAQAEVKEKFNVDLEPEVMIVRPSS